MQDSIRISMTSTLTSWRIVRRHVIKDLVMMMKGSMRFTGRETDLISV